jgi:hypothetical protein
MKTIIFMLDAACLALAYLDLAAIPILIGYYLTK